MKTLAGSALIGFAVLLCLYNVSDVLSDLRTWHDAGTPQIVAAILKQVSSVGMAALGGTLVPVPGGSK